MAHRKSTPAPVETKPELKGTPLPTLQHQACLVRGGGSSLIHFAPNPILRGRPAIPASLASRRRRADCPSVSPSSSSLLDWAGPHLISPRLARRMRQGCRGGKYGLRQCTADCCARLTGDFLCLRFRDSAGPWGGCPSRLRAGPMGMSHQPALRTSIGDVGVLHWLKNGLQPI